MLPIPAVRCCGSISPKKNWKASAAESIPRGACVSTTTPYAFPSTTRTSRLTPVPKDRARFLQGLLEGITRIEKSAYQRLQELGAGYPKRVFSSGGGARNATWMAMRQRLLHCPVLPARHLQAAYGAALIARRGLLQTKTGQ
ncbi:FGGY-family carbohydrate kinase [Thiolapillus sp.]|uniref:FGGY-family carbohydrate kinase n=1 Tax=Thiolapillus sp. TaxID=2017437 RepID=UPI003AF9EAA6